MEIVNCLKEELERLSKLNKQYEQVITNGNIKDDFNQKIVNNIEAMCQISNSLCNLRRFEID